MLKFQILNNLLIEYNSIMELHGVAMVYANKHYQHIRAGGVSHCPEVQRQRLFIELWEGTSITILGR